MLTQIINVSGLNNIVTITVVINVWKRVNCPLPYSTTTPILKTQCLKGTYGEQTKACYFCKQIGNANNGGQIITIFFDSLPSEGSSIISEDVAAKHVLDSFISTEPYGYLYRNGKIAHFN